MMEDTLARARRLVEQYMVCDHCLGRAFLEVEGKDNAERGRKIREALGVPQVDPRDCYFCMGIFGRIDELARRALWDIRGTGFTRFRIGSHLNGELIRREEELWDAAASVETETLRKHVNREVGKRVKAMDSRLQYEGEYPEVEVILDLPAGETLRITHPIILVGRYRKKAGMRQSKMLCPHCVGRGCSKCGYTGRVDRNSVEDVVGTVALGVFGGTGTRIHTPFNEGTLPVSGNGVPFALQIKEPLRCPKNAIQIIMDNVNRSGSGVELVELRRGEKGDIREIKGIKTRCYEFIFRGRPKHCEKRRVFQMIHGKGNRRVDILSVDYWQEGELLKLRMRFAGPLNVERFVSGDATRPNLRDFAEVEGTVDIRVCGV